MTEEKKETIMNYLGIDPGNKGAMALLDCEGRIIESIKMPQTPMDILTTLESICGTAGDLVCYIEDVGNGMPGQSSKATATFARHNGHLEMALLALRIPTEKITPAKWQKSLNLLTKKNERKTAHKARIKAWSQRMFPSISVTLANSDALAIAYYGYKDRKK